MIVDAVIFDMDGVMFDTAKIFKNAWDYAGKKIGIGEAGYMMQKTLGMSITMSRDIWQQEFGAIYDEHTFRRHIKEYLENFYKENKAPIKKGVYSLLQYLQCNNYKLAVASSSPEWEVEKHLKDAGICEYFDVVICGDMVTKTKPEPDIYLKTCESLGKEPMNCYAIEDSKNGVISATRAGCRAIMVPDIWQPDDEFECILWAKFNNLDEVLKYFRKNMKDGQVYEF